MAVLGVTASTHVTAQALFADDFDDGLARWTIYGVDAGHIVDSGHPAHGPVLRLLPNGDAHVLMRGSETWGGVSVEADFLFPEDTDNYLGLLYNVVQSGERMDFGNREPSILRGAWGCRAATGS